jgi:RNA polymerase sigma factor (sigma-70 family)
MTRIHQDVRLVEQMETLFHAGTLGGLSDGALLDRFQARDVAGSEAAFAELVNRHGPMVLGACRRILADPHLAEDVMQAAFLVLARRAGSVRNRDTLGGWLHRVACRIAWRSRKRGDRRKAKEEPMVEEIAAKAVDRAEDVELRSILDQEIDRLRDVQRLPVVLCCLQGLSHEEAAERLHWPLGTVKSRLARGRSKLQERLVRRGVAPALAAFVASGGLSVEAALTPALAKSTAALAWKSVSGGAATSAAVAALVRDELVSVLAIKMKVGAAVVISGLAAVAVGFFAPAISGRKPSGENLPKQAAVQDEDRKPAPPPIVAKLSASGRVVDPAGKPIVGAKVYLREWSVRRVGGLTPSEARKVHQGESLKDVLADQTTDDEGRFAFKDVPAPGFPNVPEAGKFDFPWDIVAMASGHGLSWVQLTLENQRSPITMTLGDERTVRGKLVEPGGKPVAGAKVTVMGIDDPTRPSGNGLGTDDRLNLSWSDFLVVNTDVDGRFVIRGLPRDKVVMLVVTEPRHEQLVVHAATEPPGPGTSDRSSGVESAPKILHGDFTLTTRVADHVLRGQIVFEADGKPASKASMTYGGEIVALDAEGRFRLEGLVPGKIGLHADDRESNAAPADLEVSIPESPKETEATLTLPLGLVIQGRVLDAASSAGIRGAVVWYISDPNDGRPSSNVTLSDQTDADGRFRMVVPAGRGTVEVTSVPTGYDQPERGAIGDPPNPLFSRRVEGRAGQSIDTLSISVRRSDKLLIHVVDKDGRPVADADVSVLERASSRLNQVAGRTDERGDCRVTVGSDHPALIDVKAPDRSEGGTTTIPAKSSPGTRPARYEVRLGLLGSLAGRVVDEDGAPLPGATLTLYRNVRYPEQPERSFGKPVVIGGEVSSDGSFSFKGLIPGGSYDVTVEVGGHATATSENATIKPGQEARVKEFRLPATDQDLTGVVVNPRGKPVAGVTVNCENPTHGQVLYAPRNAVWFQNTDEQGRFRLTGLPRRANRLMAYRNEGTERNIRNLKYVDFTPGQKEVRIELPDLNERLRGIE